MTENRQPEYDHLQRAPLCWLLYAVAIFFVINAIVLANAPPISWLFPPIGLLMLVIAASFHYLRVTGYRDYLSICFGPLPLFRKNVEYSKIKSVETGKTLFLDGWGIHYSIRGGQVWNIWGYDCVLIHYRGGSVLRVGTDQPEQLARFLQSKISS